MAKKKKYKHITVRLYKHFDIDLFTLYDAGYDLGQMMSEAVVGYAHGTPVSFYVDKFINYDPKDKKSIQMAFYILNSDTATIQMLSAIRPKMVSNFCKMVLRNALVQQNIPIFFTDPKYSAYQTANLNYKKTGLPTKPCSGYYREQTLSHPGLSERIKVITSGTQNFVNSAIQTPVISIPNMQIQDFQDDGLSAVSTPELQMLQGAPFTELVESDTNKEELLQKDIPTATTNLAQNDVFISNTQDSENSDSTDTVMEVAEDQENLDNLFANL